MKSKITCIIFFLACLAAGFASCKKYLDAKSDSKLVVPTTLEELQGIVDNYIKTNQSDNSAAEASSDNYYITGADYEGLSSDYYRNLYTWAKGQQFLPGNNDWSNCYDNIFRANTVLDNLAIITEPDLSTSNNIKGQALFLRARCLLQALSLWAVAYDQTTANTDPGVPLRLGSDVNEKISRASIQEGYDRIITDLKEAADLVPVTQVSTMRPNKGAALGLLARTYLWMRKYDSCFKYANLALALNDQLYDYNSISNVNASYPFPVFSENPEILYNATMQSIPMIQNSKARMDTTLYQSFDGNDLRKTVFFKNVGNGKFAFRGSYEHGSPLFDGVATDEIYLMRAECYARQDKIDAAMNDVNTLLGKRWQSGTYSALNASSSAEALNVVLTERRKELIMRGLRWMDIKRLNKEGADLTLKRVVNNETFLLQPNSPEYALTIPDDVISISGMAQNPR